MTKKLRKMLGTIVVMVGIAVWGVVMTSEKKQHFTDLYLANIEALATGESKSQYDEVDCKTIEIVDDNGNVVSSTFKECRTLVTYGLDCTCED